MTLVTGNINRLQIFEGVSCWSVVKPGWGHWNRRICRFPVAISWLRFRNNVGINCTLWPHTVLDFCRHQQGWPGMTLNVRFNLKCVCRTVC